MNKKRALLLIPAVLLSLPLFGAGPELFYSTGKPVTSNAGTYAYSGDSAYYAEPGVIIFASPKSAFTYGKSGINLKAGELYIENISGEPMPAVKCGKTEVMSAGRAFFLSASEKSLEAVKGVTSLKSGKTEASVPEGRKFIDSSIAAGGRSQPYEGFSARLEIETEGADKSQVLKGIYNFFKSGAVKSIVTDDSAADTEVIIRLKAVVRNSDFVLTGMAKPEDGSEPAIIFSNGNYSGDAALKISLECAREISRALHEIEKRSFIRGREVTLVFDTADPKTAAEAETLIKGLPGVKNYKKEILYGAKTLFKLNTRADGYMISAMIKDRSKTLKPVKALKNKVVF